MDVIDHRSASGDDVTEHNRENSTVSILGREPAYGFDLPGPAAEYGKIGHSNCVPIDG